MSSMISRCTCCEGRRKVTGLGGMSKNCDECKGTGIIDIKEKSGEVFENIFDDSQAKVKRKYTKKSNIDWSEEKPEIQEIKE